MLHKLMFHTSNISHPLVDSSEMHANETWMTTRLMGKHKQTSSNRRRREPANDQHILII